MFLGISLLIFASYCIFSIRTTIQQKMSILIAGAALIGTTSLIYGTLMTDSRFYFLISKFFENPLIFILADNSVNERFIHVFFPIVGFIYNLGVPNGYDTFNEFMKQAYSSGFYDNLFHYYRDDYDRIMSGYGSALFELGAIGLIIPYVLYRNFRRLFINGNVYIFLYIGLNAMLLNALPFSNALVAYLFGNIIYVASTRECKPEPINIPAITES
ncbi:hypothetical protein D3C72_756420 [compost metagenome]